MARRLIVEIVGDASSLQRALGGAATSADTFGSRMSAAGEKISSVGKTLTTHLTLPIAAVAGVAAKSAIDFQNSMELIHTQAGVSQKAVDSLSKSVLAMAGSVATAPDELSAGLYHLTSQGLRGKEALDALRISAEGAKLGGADLESVTNALGATIVAHIGGVTSYSQAMGELNSIVGSGDMRMQDLADAMGTGLPANAKIAGVSLQQVGGALATFGDNNIRGAKAGTLLNSTLRIMSAPSHAAQKALASVGISADELGNKLRSGGITGAMTLLKDQMNKFGLDATQQGLVLTEAFGGKQATGVKILIDELERLKTKVADVGKGGQNFADDWQSYTKTTAYHLASMGASMQAAGISIGDVLLPVVAKLADVVGGLAQKFEDLSPGTKKFILIVAGALAAIGPVVAIVGSLTTAIGGLSTAFAFIAANPIVLAIGAVVALGAAIAAAVLWPNKLKDVLEKMGLSAHAAGEIVGGLRDIFKAVEEAGEELVAVVRSNWSTISEIIGDVVDVVQTIVETTIGVIVGLWHTFGGTLTSAAETTWGFIKDTISNALEVIHGIIDVVTGLIHGDWSKVWKGIEEIVSGTIGQIWNELRTAVNLLGDAAQLIGTAIWKGVVEPIIHLAADLLHKIEDAISAALHDIVGWAKSEAGNIGHALVDGILGPLGGLGSKVEGVVKSGLSWFHHPHLSGPPYDVARDEVGIPLGQGIVAGYLLGIAPLTGKISSTVHAALEQAKATINQYRGQLSSSWSTLVSDANTAFDGIQKAAGTMAGNLLSGLTSNNTAQQNQQNLIQAQEQLANALGASGYGSMNAVQMQALADAQTKVQIATDNLSKAVSKYGSSSTQAMQASLALQTAQTALAKAQPNLSSGVANAFAKMQAAQQGLTQAISQFGPASAQAVAANKALQSATTAAQQAVAGEGAGPQQDNDQAVVSAQQNLNQLLYAQVQTALTKKAALEQKDATARAAEKKKSMDQALAALKVQLEKEHATHAQAQAAIIALLKSYGVSYQASGKALGEAFAAGLRSAIADAEKAAQDLANAVSKYLPHSPAEKGPLSEPIGWHSYLLGNLAPAAAAASSMLASSLSAPSPAFAMAGAGGGGAQIQIDVNVPQGFVGSAQELGDAIGIAVTRSALGGNALWRQVVRQAMAT